MRKKLNIKDLGLTRSIVRVALALVLTLVVLVIATRMTTSLTREKLEDDAKTKAEQQSRYVNAVTNAIFIANSWVVNSFLSSMTDVESYKDTVTDQLVFKQVFSDGYLDNLELERVYDKLQSFLNYNIDCYSTILIFEPNVLKNYPEGIAAAMHQNDSVRLDFCKDYDIFDNALYISVKDSKISKIKFGSIRGGEKYVSTLAIPLFNSQDSVIGEFWIDTDPDIYSQLLEKYVVGDGTAAIIVNEDSRIVASTNRKSNGKMFEEVLCQIYDGSIPQRWYDEVQSHLLLDCDSYFSHEVDDVALITYIFPLHGTDYKLLIVKTEQALYSEVKHFMLFPLIIMVVSILLISACLVYIFYIFKKKNDENNRLEGELNVAAEIQRGILPKNLPTDDSQSFDIFGFQRSAKTVGGDLYDFEQKGDLLHFCIGDVSGKGMPAALVMTELSSLYRYIICYHSDPQEIVTLINKSLMEHSDESMFCTLFVGVLNLKTGSLEFCNAGHNPPMLIPNGKSEVQYLKVKPNMPIYAFENYEYQTEKLQMNAGDKLFLYTDGVTEAKNDNNSFYGDKATLASVEKHKNSTFDELVQGVLDDVKSFVKKAEQNDDITILCVAYKGLQDCTSLHYDNLKNIVPQIVDEVLATCGLTENMKFRLAIEEPIQNIADYAYESDGPLDIEIFENVRANQFEITLIDNGKPFNPLENKVPDLSVPVEERQIGGLGIFLTRNIMDEVLYECVNQQNRLKLIYKIK